MPFIETSNIRRIGPFKIPAGNFGPQTNPFATEAMPGFITPEKQPAVNPPFADPDLFERELMFRNPTRVSGARRSPLLL